MIVIEGDTTPELAGLIAQRNPDNDPEWISAIITDLEHRCTSSILKLMDAAAPLIDWDNNPPEEEEDWNKIAAAFMIVGMCRAELTDRVEQDNSNEGSPNDDEPSHIDLLVRANR